MLAAAHASSRGAYLAALYLRLDHSCGKKKAVVAVGHTIPTFAYHVLADATEYVDLGPRYFDQRDEQPVTRRLVHRLKALGYLVQPERSAA